MEATAAVLREIGQEPPFTGSRPLERVPIELSEPGDGELLVRIRAAGLCHSDLSVITGTRPRVMPMALGHEAAGEVLATGPGVEAFRDGDHVVMAFVPACGVCRFCERGRPALCEPAAAANNAGTLLSGEIRQRFADGSPLHHHLGVSAFNDYAVVSENSAVKVDDDLPFEIAALFGCAALTGAGAVLNTARESLPAESAAVFGLGGVGLSALLAAVSQGASTVVAVDRIPQKLDLALELGATHAVDASDGDTAERIKAATDGEGVELAVETAGSEKVLAEAFASTARGGTTVTAGLPHPDRILEVPALTVTAEERTLRGSYLGSCVPSRDIPRFVAMYREGKLPVNRLLSDRLTPDELNQGFDRLARGETVRQIVLFD
jgi:Zn-dependent alcohol dehydrogenase